MRNFATRLARTALVLIAVSLIPQTLNAEIQTTGGVTPTDPASWTADTTAMIGIHQAGTLLVNNGSRIVSGTSYIGQGPYNAQATINGQGSNWTARSLNIGSDFSPDPTVGVAELLISNGATVNATEYVRAGRVLNDKYTKGYIRFNQGTLTTRSLYGARSRVTGTGVINTNGLYSNMDLRFDSAASLKRNIMFDNVTVKLDLSNPANNGELGVGLGGGGSLTIVNGTNVTSSHGRLGTMDHYSTATVSGPGSSWNLGEHLIGRNTTVNILNGGTVTSKSSSFGHRGKGDVNIIGANSTFNSNYFELGGQNPLMTNGKTSTLTIKDGGALNSDRAYLGGFTFGATANIEGQGSAWNTTGEFEVRLGSTVNIANGGKVTVGGWMEMLEESVTAIEVSNNNMLTVDGDVTNDGTVRLTAGENLQAGTYTPISVTGNWLGSGTVKAFGGTWNDATQQFTVAASQTGQTGQANVIDLANSQRLMLEDQATGLSVGAAFGTHSVPTEVTFTATATDGATTSGLSLQLSNNEDILSSFDFEATGLGVGEEVLLSFELGEDVDVDNLRVWHFDGSAWTEYDASDLTVENGWAHFTVDGFSSYAISAVPEPATLSILLIGGIAAIRRRKAAA